MSYTVQNTQENEILFGRYISVFPTRYRVFICIVILDFQHVTSQCADFPDMYCLVLM